MRTPPVAVCWVSALIARARPKSATLTRLAPESGSVASRTFSGFTSRWIMPAPRAAARGPRARGERRGHRLEAPQRLAGLHRRLLADDVAQREPGNVLHHQEERPGVV